jgi:methylenetetrahydrofolate--tRNA-(uracil-5-)-methyltransferase
MISDIHIIGAGLAGCEATLVASRNGIKVRLSEMRPVKSTPVHTADSLAEIVCSNSLGSIKPTTASGCLKIELAALGSPLLQIALDNKVPAGHALAVDREIFSSAVTSLIESDPNIELVREEIEGIDPRPGTVPTLIASGPLTSDTLLRSISLLLGDNNLYFFDAISPSVANDSIDFNKAFFGSRYDPDGADYLNCPFTQSEYEIFYNALINAERIEIKDFEPDKLFEGCLPVEIVAQRGIDALRFGAMKPVGLPLPGSNSSVRENQRIAYAVVQLRREQADPESWNLVGFQTRLTYSEQKRVFRMIPGLENAEFTRFGSMHKNAYLKSPWLLEPTLQVGEFPHILVAGCLAGIEGYVEDIATGHLAGLALTALVKGMEINVPPEDTMHGSLVRAITNPKNIPFQPVAATLGLLPPLVKRIRRKKERRMASVDRSIESIKAFVETLRSKGYNIPDEVSNS